MAAKNKKKVTRKRVVRGKTAKKTSARRPSTRTAKRLQLRAASPSFTVDDIDNSLAWYRDVLGFTLKERWEHDGRLMGAEMAAGSVTLYIGQDDWKKGRDRVKGEGFRMYCTTTQDVDAIAAQIRSRGGRLIEEPHDEPWGGRAFAVADPDGFKITITTAD